MKDSTSIVDIKGLARNILNVIDKSPWRDTYSDRIRFLVKEAENPCELAIVGEVSAGKSSFINTILGKDLAVVGALETTATINFFKYGEPIDKKHPVKVVWEDGSEEWQTREFLDSLQGNTKEIIDRANGIDHLEYFLKEDVLKRLTIIDTPGTGSLIDAHSSRIQDYIVEQCRLRDKHNEQSVALKNRADAVIVITGRVPNMSTSDLISSFSQKTSSFNSIGVMTKIDIENNVSTEDWQRRCSDYSKMLQHQLNTIVPVSAQTFQAVKELEKTGKLSVFAEALKNIPSDEFDEVCNSEVFLSKEADEYFTNYNLPYNLRVDLASNLEPTVFYHIAKEFHKFPIEEATRHLIKYSGMDYVKAILKKHFFDRSDIIRCSKVASEFHDLLEEILNNKLYKLRREVDNKLTYLNIIRNSLANKNVKQDFTNFVNDNICSIDDYTDYVKEIKELIKQTESLQQLFSITDIKCEALILLEEKQSSFSPKELEELEMLFGKKYSEKSMPTDGKYLFTRQLYWRGRKDVIYDPEVKRIVEHAIYVYENLNPQ